MVYAYSLRSRMVNLILVLLVADLVLLGVVMVVVQGVSSALGEVLRNPEGGRLQDPTASDVLPTLFDALTTRVRRLAQQADVPVPEARVLESEFENSVTVGRSGNATIYVTEELARRLSGEEIDAVLAHELAHVKNRDLTVTTVVSSAVYVAYAWFHASLYYLVRALAVVVLLTAVELLVQITLGWIEGVGLLVGVTLGVPVALAMAVVVGGLFLAVGLLPFLFLDVLTSRFSQVREYAADAGAAAILGDPAPLASALDSLSNAAGNPDEDLREAWSAVRPLCMVSGPGTDGEEDEDDHGGSESGDPRPGSLWPRLIPVGKFHSYAVEHALTSSHPPIEDRVTSSAP